MTSGAGVEVPFLAVGSWPVPDRCLVGWVCGGAVCCGPGHPRQSGTVLPVGVGARRTTISENVHDGGDGDAVAVADLENADAGLLPFPGVRHLARPPGTQPEDRAKGGQVGGGTEAADRFGGPLAGHRAFSLRCRAASL